MSFMLFQDKRVLRTILSWNMTR